MFPRTWILKFENFSRECSTPSGTFKLVDLSINSKISLSFQNHLDLIYLFFKAFGECSNRTETFKTIFALPPLFKGSLGLGLLLFKNLGECYNRIGTLKLTDYRLGRNRTLKNVQVYISQLRPPWP
jgi:hypothetical protein